MLFRSGMCRSDPLEEKKASRSRQRAGHGNQNREIAQPFCRWKAAGREQFQNIFEWKEQTESTLSFDVYILYSKEDGGILSVFFSFAGKRSGVCLNIHFLRKERFKYVLIWWEYVLVRNSSAQVCAHAAQTVRT